MHELPELIRRLRARIGLVVGIAVAVALLAAWYASTGSESATARATLVIGSGSASFRTAEQDLALATGYVQLVGSDQYQGRLREEAGVGPEVTIEARTIADGPFIELSATAPDAETAISSASAMARTLTQRSRTAFDTIAEERAASIRSRLLDVAEQLAELDAGGTTVQPSRASLIALRSALQGQLDSLVTAGGNSAGVSVFDEPTTAEVTAPSVARNGVLGGIAGLVLGAFVALALTRLQRASQVREDEVLEELGLTVVGALNESGEGGVHPRVVLADRAGGGTRRLAITGAEPADTAAVARVVAREAAAGGDRVVVVGPDPEAAPKASTEEGLVLRETRVRGVRRVSVTTGQPGRAALDSEALAELLAAVARDADLVILDAARPAVSGDGRQMIDVADAALVAVGGLRPALAEARPTLSALSRQDLPVIGAVIVRGHPSGSAASGRRAAGWRRGSR